VVAVALSRFVTTADINAEAWPTAGSLVTTPSVPASTVAVNNANAFPVSVTITGGTMTAVVVNGVTVGTGAGTYVVSAGGTISMTYTVAPTWLWSAFGLQPAGYFQPRLPKGTVVYADSSAGSTAPQLLYQYLNGVSALRAFVQGQDDVGHQALAN